MLLDKGSGLPTHETVSIHIVIILRLLRIVHMKPVLFENVRNEKTVILQKPLCSNVWKVYDTSLIHQAVAIYCMYIYYYGFRLNGSRKTMQKLPNKRHKCCQLNRDVYFAAEIKIITKHKNTNNVTSLYLGQCLGCFVTKGLFRHDPLVRA
jgi:hypothetical protein